MLEFFTSPIFIAGIAGFVIMYVIQVVIKGPQEADKKNRIEEYMGRLSDDTRAQIEQVLASGDKIGAIKMFRMEAGVGLMEAKECIKFIEKQMG